MNYLISLLEGIVTFISPCMLPMLPIYVSYFAAGENDKRKAFFSSLGFVLGFTAVFISLGAFAGTFGRLLADYGKWVNLTAGAVITVFGLNYLNIFSLPFLHGYRRIDYRPEKRGFFSSALFGMVFSIGWTPCVGTFLGSALMLAASSQNSAKGIMMLLCYSLGLGIPFVLSALLIDRLKRVFDFIKRNYRVINAVSGILLVAVGISMMTGMLGRLLVILSF